MMPSSEILIDTDLDFPLLSRGKVRDVYEIGPDQLLLVATDRISAFDVVMKEGIPKKGEVLSRLSAFWFNRTAEVIPNAFLGLLNDDNAQAFNLTGIDPKYFGRSIIMKKADPLPVECVVRGYLSGSGWKDYQSHRAIADVLLDEGLLESSQLPNPTFTPSTKAIPPEHDRPMTYREVEDLIGNEFANAIKVRALALYGFGSQECRKKGIIVADTKFEFGLIDGEPSLIDEVMTPDSSRFWSVDEYFPGKPQSSYDKQPLRDFLETLKWDKEPPPPILPDEIIKATTARYVRAFELITGTTLD